MSFQSKSDEKEKDEDREWTVFDGLNIHFEGLVILQIKDKNYDRNQYINQSMYTESEIIDCKWILDIKNAWKICCKANSKKEAIKLIKEHMGRVLKKESIHFANMRIDISLSYLNHKEKGRPLADPIDYSLFESFSKELISILPKLFEPLSSQCVEWEKSKWSE